MNYYPFHIGDYATNTRHLDLIEDAIYRRLIDLYYLRDGVLAADIDQLARLICARSNRNEVEAIVNEFFTIEDGMLKHSRCDEEIARFNDKVEKSKAAGKASAASRKTNVVQESNASSTDVQRTFNQNLTDVQPSNIQEPRTNNQYEDTNVSSGEESAPAVADAKPTTPAKKFIKPTAEELAGYASEIEFAGFNPSKFLNHYDSNGWMVGRNKMKDWRAAVRNWKTSDFGKPVSKPSSHTGFATKNYSVGATQLDPDDWAARIGGSA
jgi:uncharacterized protein YdaU (DUF1376 family)